jgi:signal peptide peptidase SppA
VKYQNIVRAILAKPWAIDPESVAWAAILDVLSLRAAGDVLTDAEIEARIAAAANGPRSGPARNRNVAVIPIYGVITPRGNMMARTSGGTTAESIRNEFRAALADSEVDGIVFDVDSPGGAVEGINELAEEIRAARGVKPIAAVANHMAASAAYWAIAGVDEIVATGSASVGSIGVFTAHQDVSAAMEREGVVTTLISAGKYKVEGNQFAPLAEEARDNIQEQVDGWYAMMTNSIAKGRGIKGADVRKSYGEGRTFMADKALAAGLVDRIDSLDNTIRRVARGQVGGRPAGGSVSLRGQTIIVGEYGPEEFLTTTEFHPEAGAASPDVLGAGTFGARVEAAAAEIRAIRAEALKRIDIRADEGRGPTAADRLAMSLTVGATVGDEEPEDDEAPEEALTTEEPVAVRHDLEILELAARGGYHLPI